MPYNGNRRRGIAGIPGRNLNSVRGSLDISGLYPVRMYHGGTPHVEERADAEAQIRDYINFQAGTRPSSTATLEELEAQEGIFKTYLGDTGYDQERDKDKSNAKLQAALALAQAGFGLMGAQPGEGESPMSVAGRAFGAPLAGRMSEIAGTFSERDAARRAAQRSEERQIKLQAFQDVTARKQAEATRYTEDRERAYTAIQSGTSFLKNQQTKIDGAWTDVGQIKVVMTGQFKNNPEYYNATTGAKITTPIRDFLAPERAPKDSVTKLNPTVRWISAGTDEDPNAGYWLEVPAYSRVEYNRDRSVSGTSLHFFNDDSEARFEDQLIKQPNGTEVTLTANAKFKPSSGTSGGVYDTGQAQQWVKEGDKLVLGPVVETKALRIDGEMTQVRVDDNTQISVGTGEGEYQLYKKPTAAAVPTDTSDPEFQATFRGLLANLPGMRESMDLGQRGLAFDPAKFNTNPDLTPGENFPFTRVDGEALTEDQQENYARSLKDAYFNVFKSIKAGQEKTDLNRAFVTGYLDYSVGNLGLPQAPEGQRLLTTPADIQRAYVGAAEKFKTSPDAETIIENLPSPVGQKNLTSGPGRLSLFYTLGVPFGATTRAPEALLPDPSSTDVSARATAVRSLVKDNRDNIQERIIAEKLARSTTPLGSKLTPRNADTLGKQLPIVGDALQAQKDKLRAALDDSSGKEIGETVGKSLDTIAMLDRLDALMKISGVSGFITGPVEQFASARFDMDIGGWFRTEAGQEAARELMASLPILQQLTSRDLLKGVGEQRISNTDLSGVQTTLININKDDGFNARTLRQLRNYLKRSVTHSLDYVGSYGLPEKTLHRAAQLGIDVKSIEGRNGFYSPYLADQTYAVSKQPVPSYSKEYQTQLADESIFGYVARSGGQGQAKQYELIMVDEAGEPMWDEGDKKYKTTLIPHGEGWQAGANKTMLDFNRNFLMQTYGLDR